MSYLDDILKDENRTIVRHPLDFTNQDPRFEEEEVPLLGLAVCVSDGEPIVGEQPAELVDVPPVAFDAREELVIGGAVRH